MSYEQSTQPTPQEAHEHNHGELLEVMGSLQATITSNYRNEKPRSPEHVRKQEELLAMLRQGWGPLLLALRQARAVWYSSCDERALGSPFEMRLNEERQYERGCPNLTG